MKIIKLIIIVSVPLFFLGCNKNDDDVFLNGNIVGVVKLVNEDGNEILDNSGVTVSIEGRNNSALSTENGRFEITNVPAGTYNLIYSKEGYGSYKRFGYQFIGGDIPGLIDETTIYEQPKIEIKDLNISSDGYLIYIRLGINRESRFGLETYINDSSNVTNEHYDFYSGVITGGSTETTITDYIYLDDTPYSPGDKVYIVLYFNNPLESFRYYNYEKDMYLYSSSKKASEVIEFVIE